MGVANSKRPRTGAEAEEVWVHVKTKTTDKRTRNVTKRKWGFRATRAGVVLGSAGAECDITVDDPALSPQHVRIALADDGDGVLLTALGRTYLLIGQGSRSGQCVPLEREQVVKMGACSLAVVDTVLSVAERQVRLAAAAAATAAAKAGAAAAAAAASSPPPPSSSGDSGAPGDSAAPAAAAAADDGFGAGASTRVTDGSAAEGDGGGDGVRRPPLHPAATLAPAAAVGGHAGRAHSQLHMSSVSLPPPPPGLRARAASAMSEDEARSNSGGGGGGAPAGGGGGGGGSFTSAPTSPMLAPAAAAGGAASADGLPDGAGSSSGDGSGGSAAAAAPPPLTPSPDGAVDREGVCYICFDGGEGAAAVSAVAPATGADGEALGDPLVPSQCACRKLVHRSCLSRWIATKGSRLCSICKSKLPVDFTVDPPYVVLQVVRHMRGLHWNGEREYVVSFAPATGHPDVVTVGSWHDCDLVLPDPSLSRNHARLHFHRGSAPSSAGPAPNSGGSSGSGSGSSATYFAVEDLGSSAGTYLKLSADRPHRIATTALPPYGAAATSGASATGEASSSSVGSPGSGVGSSGSGCAPGPLDGAGQTATYKLGRTVMTVRVRRRRAGSLGGVLGGLTAGLGHHVGLGLGGTLAHLGLGGGGGGGSSASPPGPLHAAQQPVPAGGVRLPPPAAGTAASRARSVPAAAPSVAVPAAAVGASAGASAVPPVQRSLSTGAVPVPHHHVLPQPAPQAPAVPPPVATASATVATAMGPPPTAFSFAGSPRALGGSGGSSSDAAAAVAAAAAAAALPRPSSSPARPTGAAARWPAYPVTTAPAAAGDSGLPLVARAATDDVAAGAPPASAHAATAAIPHSALDAPTRPDGAADADMVSPTTSPALGAVGGDLALLSHLQELAAAAGFDLSVGGTPVPGSVPVPVPGVGHVLVSPRPGGPPVVGTVTSPVALAGRVAQLSPEAAAAAAAAAAAVAAASAARDAQGHQQQHHHHHDVTAASPPVIYRDDELAAAGLEEEGEDEEDDDHGFDPFAYEDGAEAALQQQVLQQQQQQAAGAGGRGGGVASGAAAAGAPRGGGHAR